MRIDLPENVRPLTRSDPPLDSPRFCLDHLADDALLRQLKGLIGRANRDCALVLAHLPEVEARGVHRQSACSSVYTYCVYELRMSEDEALRRIRAARTARRFPLLFEMIEDASIHLTGILLLAPHLTQENQAELLTRSRYRTKREIQHLIAEIAPKGVGQCPGGASAGNSSPREHNRAASATTEIDPEHEFPQRQPPLKSSPGSDGLGAQLNLTESRGGRRVS